MEEYIKTEEDVSTADKKQITITPIQAILMNAIIIAIAIIIGALIIHGSFDGGVKKAGADTTSGQAPVAVDIKNVTLSGEPFIGNPKAKVVVAYWSDYQCPFCKKFETGAFQDVVKNYVNTGKVAIVFKDYSFLGDDSTTAALYERAVWNLYPDQYFAWREAMYNAQDGENTGFGNEASVAKLTGTISGIDATKVASDIQKNKDAYTKLIDASRAEAVGFGIQGTPSFVTDTELIPGLVSYDVFAKALDKQLK